MRLSVRPPSARLPLPRCRGVVDSSVRTEAAPRGRRRPGPGPGRDTCSFGGRSKSCQCRPAWPARRQLADDRGGGLVAAVLQLGPDFGSTVLAAASVVPVVVVDHLGVDVLRAAEDGQPGPLGRPVEPLADAPLAARAGASGPAGGDWRCLTRTILDRSLRRRCRLAARTPMVAPDASRVRRGRPGSVRLLRAERLAGLAADDSRPRSGCPCPCTARAGGRRGPRRRTGRRPACRRR